MKVLGVCKGWGLERGGGGDDDGSGNVNSVSSGHHLIS